MVHTPSTMTPAPGTDCLRAGDPGGVRGPGHTSIRGSVHGAVPGAVRGAAAGPVRGHAGDPPRRRLPRGTRFVHMLAGGCLALLLASPLAAHPGPDHGHPHPVPLAGAERAQQDTPQDPAGAAAGPAPAMTGDGPTAFAPTGTREADASGNAAAASPAAPGAESAPDTAPLQALFDAAFRQRLQAIEYFSAHPGPVAQRVLTALSAGTLARAADGAVLIGAAPGEPPAWRDALSDRVIDSPVSAAGTASPTPAPPLNNRLRRLVQAALGSYALQDPDPDVRTRAIREALRDPARIPVALVEQAQASETDPDLQQDLRVLNALQRVVARTTPAADPGWQADAPAAARTGIIAALDVLAHAAPADVRRHLRALTEDTTLAPPLATAAQAALQTYESRHQRAEWLNTAFSGLSAASILLLAALGLAITYGLMGVINMAHGELLMIGAYATYVTQEMVRSVAPDWLGIYPVLAIPVAFVSAALVGMLIEWLVLRHLYGKPVDSLLATFGISLILMQTCRTIFGAQNVEVANPDWLSGAARPLQDIVPGLQLLYSRIAVLAFALVVVLLVWAIIRFTRLGLFVRAVTQNRTMAACTGVHTRRIDNLTFGLGAGIAGLGGLALSQIANVGPDLGQSHIIDSFMVVVLGGVGQLAGTVVTSIGLGVTSKLGEPVLGAVLTKIAILMLIVLFIQKRPQGIFALKGRSAEA